MGLCNNYLGTKLFKLDFKIKRQQSKTTTLCYGAEICCGIVCMCE